MDIKKIKDIVDSSQLSQEAKDLIAELLPQADKTEIKEEILKTLEYEITTNGLLADEADEVMDELRSTEIELDAADKVEDEQFVEVTQKYKEKMDLAEAEMKSAMDFKDEAIEAVSALGIQNTVSVETVPATPLVTTSTVAPVVTETPVQQNPGYGGQQYNAEMPAQTPTQTQPAAFPTAPVMNGQQ